MLNTLHLALTLLSVRTSLLPKRPTSLAYSHYPAPQFHDAFQNASYVTAFTEKYVLSSHTWLQIPFAPDKRLRSLTAILVSRFLLDLQRANLEALDLHTSTGSLPDGQPQSRFQGGSLVFNNFVDSLGGSIALSSGSFHLHDEVRDENEREEQESAQGIELEKVGGD